MGKIVCLWKFQYSIKKQTWRKIMISDYDLGEIVEDLLPEPSNFFILRYSNGYILHCHVGKCRKLYKIDPITGEEILIEVEGEDTFSIPLPELK
ncbi:MAG: hypothetical protein SO084_11210 [Butyricimonas virosa]|nr:hypothetical protein [Butyricimonas virosa]